MDIGKGTRDYVERMTEIRTLSTPSLEGIEDADAYGRILQENFVRIGKLASKNRDLLEQYLYPLLNGREYDGCRECTYASSGANHEEGQAFNGRMLFWEQRRLMEEIYLQVPEYNQ